jgi:ABC-type sugar transport system substrate-binding protein
MASHRSPLARPWNRLLVGAAAGSLVLAAAGCSSGGSGSDTASAGGGDLSAAQQECVDKASAFRDERGLLPETLPEGLTPLSKPPTEGLTISRLSPGSVPTSVALSNKIVELAPEIGWTGKNVTYDGSVEDLNRKALEAMDSSDIVVVDGIPTAAIQEPIRVAQEKGVLLLDGSISEAPVSVPGFGGTPYGGDTFDKLGEVAMNGILQANNCQGGVAVFSLPVPNLQSEGDTMEAILAEECPDCAFSYTDIPFSDIGSPAATNAVVSKLQSDPSIKFAYFTIGDLAVGLGPALKQAGIDVQIGGAIPVPQNLDATKAGENEFWLGFPQETSAWNILDTAARALDTGEPVVGNHYPVPMYTPDNIEVTDHIPAYPQDMGEQYKELWQLN